LRIHSLNPCPENLPGHGRLVLAFSGGADSTALAALLAASRIKRDIVCVHVDHGIDPQSAERAEAASSIAARIELPFVTEQVLVDTTGNQEAAARRARYAALSKHVRAGDCLLTAHHADDQVETIFLRLLRGAGPGGLAGIPRERRFGKAWVVRPLLDWTRTELQDHCRQKGLDWIEDPSNDCLTADRNFLRHQILPVLRGRWPGLDQSVLRSGRLSGQAARSIEAFIRPHLSSAMASRNRLDAHYLQTLSELELAEAIRVWCQDNVGGAPPGKRLDEFLLQVRTSEQDQIPEMRWQRSIVRFWNRNFWLDSKGLIQNYAMDWQIDRALSLPENLGRLQMNGSVKAPPLALRVRSGRSGERLKLSDKASTRRVKDLLRERRIPPWQRDLWPRIYHEDKLLAVGDRWIDHSFAHWLKNQQLELKWHAVDFGPNSTERNEDEP